MARPEKVAAVAKIKERIEGARAVFLAEYAGLSVKQQQELRRGLREQGAEFKVVKMTLARRAAADLDLDELDELLIGPTGIAFADDDAVSAAKALKEFGAGHEAFSVKGGLLGTDFLTPERIAELAEVAPREELLAMLAGALKAPLTSMAGLLAALPRGAATVFQQLLEKKQSGEFAGDGDTVEETAPETADEAGAEAAAEADAGEDADAEEPVAGADDTAVAEDEAPAAAASTDEAEDGAAQAEDDVSDSDTDEDEPAEPAEEEA